MESLYFEDAKRQIPKEQLNKMKEDLEFAIKKYKESVSVLLQICEDSGIFVDLPEVKLRDIDYTNFEEMKSKHDELQIRNSVIKDEIKKIISSVYTKKWEAVIDKAYGEEDKIQIKALVDRMVKMSPIEIYLAWSDTFDLLERICGKGASREAALATLSIKASNMSIEDIINILGILKDVKEPYINDIKFAFTEGVKQNRDIRVPDAILALFPKAKERIKEYNLNRKISNAEKKEIKERYRVQDIIVEFEKDSNGNTIVILMDMNSKGGRQKTQPSGDDFSENPSQPGSNE